MHLQIEFDEAGLGKCVRSGVICTKSVGLIRTDEDV